MRRLYAWLAGFVGGAAAYRAFKRTPRPEPKPQDGADPAEELKAKLAEARAGDAGRDSAETPVDEAPDPDVDARRRAVHEQARSAIDEMRSE
jgi:hypothetical protein